MSEMKELFAFIAKEDTTGDESIIGISINNLWIPFASSDLKQIERLEPIARNIAAATKKSIKLSRFTGREDIKEITP